MCCRLYLTMIVLAIAALVELRANAADYRGMSSGWPVYANGYNAAGYAAQPASGPAYYVARPVSANQLAAPSRTGVMYMPVRAAYANPRYYAAYGRSPVGYQPVQTAGYASAGGAYYAPAATNTYYAPVTANYAPANSYAVTPAGMSSAGSEAATYYAQPTTVNYVPPRYSYRPAYAAVPVYMYRPVTTYDPITAQPVTCLQPTTASTCQPTCQKQRSCFSWLNPLNWFGRGSSCGSSRCGAAPVPTTSYCGTAASQCGQPYYPVQPGIPVVPGPATTLPPTTLPPNAIPAVPGSTFIPRGGTTVPPPPTVPFGSRGGITTTPGAQPADLQPRLPAGTPVPGPAGSFPSGSGTFTPLPSTTAPQGGSFGAPPPTSPPGSFGTSTNFPPAADPNSPAQAPPSQADSNEKSSAAPEKSSSPPRSVFGSGYRTTPAPSSDQPVIRAPELRPAMPPHVETVPDIDAPKTPRPVNSAPQLLNPRDKTARYGSRWAVVPALWPQSPKRSLQPVSLRTPQIPPPTSATLYDDRGWHTAN